jgi:hypothetical protein
MRRILVKSVKVFVLAAVVLAFAQAGLPGKAFALSDADHKKMMSDETYSASWEQLNEGVMGEAREALSGEDFKALEKLNADWMKNGIDADAKKRLEDGTDTKEMAYAEALDTRVNRIARALVWSEIVGKDDGVQGVYVKDDDDSRGSLTVVKNDDGKYGVELEVTMAWGNGGGGAFSGVGELAGKTMKASDPDDNNNKTAYATFVFGKDGAEVETTDEFRENYGGMNMGFGGTFKRLKSVLDSLK